MWFIGLVLVISGLASIAVGISILGLSALQLWRQIFPARPARAAAAGVGADDLAKLIEAIVKIPQWLLAILAGDLQIWLGIRLMSGLALLPWA
jgi:hypothetical protein